MAKEVYGTTPAAAKWREAFTGYMVQSLGYEKSRHDSCLYLLKPRQARAIVDHRDARRKKINLDDQSGWITMEVHEEYNQPGAGQGEETHYDVHGTVVIQVDDILEQGDSVHEAQIMKLRKRFKFGKYGTCRCKGGDVFNG